MLYRNTSSRMIYFFFFSSRRRHTRLQGDWSSDVCSSDLRLSWDCRRKSAIRQFPGFVRPGWCPSPDRKSTRLNSSHLVISYAVFCLKKKKKTDTNPKNELQLRHQLECYSDVHSYERDSTL